MPLTIPPMIEDQYEGRWIAWDTETNEVIADGDSMRQVMDLAKDHSNRTGHLIWYHHSVRRDAVLIGGIG